MLSEVQYYDENVKVSSNMFLSWKHLKGISSDSPWQIWHCLIYNGTLRKQIPTQIAFNSDYFSIITCKQEMRKSFLQKIHTSNKQIKQTKT